MERTQVVELTAENFERVILTSPQPTLVDFWAPWCASCQLMSPVVDTVAELFAGRLTVGKVNIDRHPVIAADYEIASIPTLLLLVGGEVVREWMGVLFSWFNSLATLLRPSSACWRCR